MRKNSKDVDRFKSQYIVAFWIGTAMRMVEWFVFGNGFWILYIYGKYTS
jgi:hypothetical protein